MHDVNETSLNLSKALLTLHRLTFEEKHNSTDRKLAVSALAKARDLTGSLALKAIPFSNASSALSEEALVNIDHLAELMQKREKFSIRLCPFYSAEEISTLENTAGDGVSVEKYLNETRITAVKDQLIKAAVNGQRIAPCAPKLTEGDTLPRIHPNF